MLDSFTDALKTHELLSPEAATELPRLAAKCSSVDELARELVSRRWLTPFQAQLITAGRANELIIGGYCLLSPIGEGGMGVVYKAEQRRLGRLVAVKVIHQEYLAQRPEAQKRFQREARAAAQLTHPNTIRVYDADQDGLRHFIVMEYVEGTDLARLVEHGGPLPVAVACDYIAQAALGIQHAHELGLIHRDVKPSNLLISRSPLNAMRAAASETATGRPSPPVSWQELRQSGQVKIVDLGLARVMQTAEAEQSGALTVEGNVMGTPDYIAPEQARSPHKVDGRADIYSLGCTFYFALAGRPPFPKASALEKLLMQQLDEPIPIEAVRPEVPLSVAQILRRMMAKEPAQRFQTALEVNYALTAIAAEVACIPVDPPRQADEALVESTAECVVEPAQPASVVVPDLDQLPPANPVRTEPSVDWPSILEEPPQVDVNEQKLTKPAPRDLLSDKDFQWKSLDELPPAHPRDPSYHTPLEFMGKPPSTVDEPIPGPPTQVTLPEIPDIPLNTAAQIQLEWSRRLDDKTIAPQAVPLELIKGHRGCVVSLAFAHQDDVLATAGIDGSVKLWHLAGARSKLLSVLQSGGSEVHSISFAPSDQLAAYGTVDGRLWICLIAGEQSGPFDLMQLERERISCVRFSPDGRYIGVAMGKQVTIFEIKANKLRRWAELGPHDGAVLAFEFCPTGKFVATISQDGAAHIWNPHRYWQKQVSRIGVPDVNCLAYSSDGKLLALGTSSRTIQVWDIAANPPQRFSRMAYNHGSLRQIMFPPDRQALLTVEDQGFAALRDLQTGNNIQEWSVPFIKAYTFALAADGRSLATGNTDGTVLIHSL